MRESYHSGGGTSFDWPLFIGYGRPPYASIDAGPFAILAGPAGVAVGSFGWVNPANGLVTNTQVEGAALGFILPVPWLGDPEVAIWNCANGFWQRVLRPGMSCVVAAIGEFVPTFPQGAQVGSQVYVDPTTGLPYTDSNGGAYVETPWTAMRSCGAMSRTRISSFVSPFN